MQWHEVVELPVRRGDQPSEILPMLFLSGHPARYTGKSSFGAHYSKNLSENFRVALIINCAAGKSVSRFVVENLHDGTKTPIDDVQVFTEKLSAYAQGGDQHSVFFINVPADDVDDFHISQFFPLTTPIIGSLLPYTANDTQSPVGVLVHCQMGVSRSASVLAAFLMSRFQKNADEVLDHMTQRRSCVDVNPGFYEQLKSWEAKCTA